MNAVERGSAAEKAGLLAGDRILTLQGEAVRALQPVDVPALQRRLAELPVGAAVAPGHRPRRQAQRHFRWWPRACPTTRSTSTRSPRSACRWPK